MRYGLVFHHTLLFLIAIAVCPARSSIAASDHPDALCGYYPGRVLTELAMHRQYASKRAARGFAAQALSAPPAAGAGTDIGNIAVIPDDGTMVIPANPFDLAQKSIMFQSGLSGYSVSMQPVSFDAEAAAKGLLLNPAPAGNPESIGDDGSQEVVIGFPFPYFGKTYNSIFINSDGNLTFEKGDAGSLDRSLARFVGGSPRIAPFYSDLDPSSGGKLTYLSSGSRFVVTWTQVPDYASSGFGPAETFQVILTPDGTIQFAYGAVNGQHAVVGISPGSFAGLPGLIDLSAADGGNFTGAVGEAFTSTTQLDLAAVAQRFYKTHDDAYEYLAISTNFDFDLQGSFSYELNVANQATGIGHISTNPVFDYSSDFGSSRLQSVINLGNLLRYPADPALVFFRGVDSALSILSHEAGHRFLAYADYDDRAGNPRSSALLGRDLQHWSFLFNSDGSVMEGNRIRDNGNGTFTTIGAVDRYSELDQYLMGLRTPAEVSPMFLVQSTGIPISPARSPALNVNFPGKRLDFTLDQIISADGPRIPNTVTSPKAFNVAFVLVIPRGQSAVPQQITQLDTLRRAWEGFYAKAASSRAVVNTALVRSLRLSPNPAGLFPTGQIQGKVETLSPVTGDLVVGLSSSNSSTVSVPAQVTIPSGAQAVTFPVLAGGPGIASLSSSAIGFETSTAVIDVLPGPSATSLSLSAVSGNLQTAAQGGLLPQLLQVNLIDSNRIPYAGATVDFTAASGAATFSPASAITDGQGNAVTAVTLAAGCTASVAITATLRGTSLTVKFNETCQAIVPLGPVAVVNAAGGLRASNSISPGSLISIYGSNLSNSTATASTLPLQVNLADTIVRIGGLAAPLLYVSSTQINAQVPFEVSAAQPSMTIEHPSTISPPIPLSWAAAAPGIFTWDSSGSGPGAILHSANFHPVNDESPAAQLEVMTFYATGLGSVTPASPSGSAAPGSPPSQTTLRSVVTMNGVPAVVSFSGLAPGFAGLYQVNAQVPQGVAGKVEVVLTVNGVDSNTVDMQVQ